MKQQISVHCAESRLDRLAHIATTIGFGEIVEKFPGRNQYGRTVHCLTDTGVVIIKDATESIIVTAFAIRIDRLYAYYQTNYQRKPPEYLINIVRNNEKKRKYLYDQVLTNCPAYAIIRPSKGKEMIQMTKEEFIEKFTEYYFHHENEPIDDIINDFCNINATSYEEYMAMWAILGDAFTEV